jgi:hypothetical protein
MREWSTPSVPRRRLRSASFRTSVTPPSLPRNPQFRPGPVGAGDDQSHDRRSRPRDGPGGQSAPADHGRVLSWWDPEPLEDQRVGPGGFRLLTFERKLCPTKPASAGIALLARSSWQINSWGSLLPPSATTLPRPERCPTQDVCWGWSIDRPDPDEEVPPTASAYTSNSTSTSWGRFGESPDLGHDLALESGSSTPIKPVRWISPWLVHLGIASMPEAQGPQGPLGFRLP